MHWQSTVRFSNKLQRKAMNISATVGNKGWILGLGVFPDKCVGCEHHRNHVNQSSQISARLLFFLNAWFGGEGSREQLSPSWTTMFSSNVSGVAFYFRRTPFAALPGLQCSFAERPLAPKPCGAQPHPAALARPTPPPFIIL